MGYRGEQLDNEIIAKIGVPSVLRDLRIPGTPEHYGGRHAGPHPPDGFVDLGGFWVPDELVRNQEQVSYGQRRHPRGIGYNLGAVTRGRNHRPRR